MAIFDVADYKAVIQKVIDGEFNVISRTRLHTEIYRAHSKEPESCK